MRETLPIVSKGYSLEFREKLWEISIAWFKNWWERKFLPLEIHEQSKFCSLRTEFAMKLITSFGDYRNVEIPRFGKFTADQIISLGNSSGLWRGILRKDALRIRNNSSETTQNELYYSGKSENTSISTRISWRSQAFAWIIGEKSCSPTPRTLRRILFLSLGYTGVFDEVIKEIHSFVQGLAKHWNSSHEQIHTKGGITSLRNS